MISPSNRVRIVIATKPVAFRKQHDGLVAHVKSVLRKDPFTGTVFAFRTLEAIAAGHPNSRIDELLPFRPSSS